MITTNAANAGPNLVSIGPVMVRRKAHAGPFPEKRQKRYEKWPPSHMEREEHPKNDEQTNAANNNSFSAGSNVDCLPIQKTENSWKK